VFEHSFTVTCDGGALQNGTPQAQGFASYLLESRTGKRQIVRLGDLPGVTTNNQAEYVALILRLVDLRGGSSGQARARAATAWRSAPIPSSWSAS